jgi:hypothetical protein
MTGALQKMLFYDIVCQSCSAVAIELVDASNCYNQIAHAMASLIFQSFGVESTAVLSMLEAIQEMKFFLQTAYGNSKTFAGSSIKIQMQGLGQGNWASPMGWGVISITIFVGAWCKRTRCTFPCADVPGLMQSVRYIVC